MPSVRDDVGEGVGVTIMWQEGDLCGDGEVLYLDCRGSYIDLHRW